MQTPVTADASYPRERITAGILAGVSGGLSISAAIGLDIPRLVLPRFDLVSVSATAAGGAIAAAAFASPPAHASLSFQDLT